MWNVSFTEKISLLGVLSKMSEQWNSATDSNPGYPAKVQIPQRLSVVRYMKVCLFLFKSSISYVFLSQAAQKMNSYQFATTTVTFSVQAKSLHPPQFQMLQYDGTVTGVGKMAMDQKNKDEPLLILATDADYAATGVKRWFQTLFTSLIQSCVSKYVSLQTDWLLAKLIIGSSIFPIVSISVFFVCSQIKEIRKCATLALT